MDQAACRGMGWNGGVHGTNHAHVVDHARKLRQQFADLDSVPALPRELEIGRQQASGLPLRAQIDRVGALALGLPKDNWSGQADGAFIVSWDDNGRWTTHTYNRSKLPAEVWAVCQIIGLPETWL